MRQISAVTETYAVKQIKYFHGFGKRKF